MKLETLTICNLSKLGFLPGEIEGLAKIERALHRWDEAECGNERGCITRDEDTGKPFWKNAMTGDMTPIQDREAGALKRLGKIMARHTDFLAYHQGDCRGCALYIVPVECVNGTERIESVYTRGVAIC